jgi:hypothetical protein
LVGLGEAPVDDDDVAPPPGAFAAFVAPLTPVPSSLDAVALGAASDDEPALPIVAPAGGEACPIDGLETTTNAAPTPTRAPRLLHVVRTADTRRR